MKKQNKKKTEIEPNTKRACVNKLVNKQRINKLSTNNNYAGQNLVSSYSERLMPIISTNKMINVIIQFDSAIKPTNSKFGS